MTAIALTTPSVPQPLLPALARFAVAVAVGAALTVLCVGAESASHQAVDNSTMAMSVAPVRYVNLPMVEITGKRETGGAVAAGRAERIVR